MKNTSALSLLFSLLFSLQGMTSAAAQEVTALPYDHWSRTVLARLAGTDPADAGALLHAWPMSRSRALALLEGDDSPPFEHASRLLRHEQGRLRIAVELGFAGHEDRLRAGRADRANALYPGPIALDDAAGFAANVRVDAALSDRFALSLEVRDTAGAPRLAEATASLRLGPVLFRAGRVPLSFGSTAGSTFVLHDLPPQTGAVLHVPDGFVLPGFLGLLGRIRLTQFVGRMHRSGDIAHPWLTATRVSFAFSPRFVFGVQRAMILGGEGNEGITPRRVLLALIGLTDTEGKTTDFENQVVGVDAFWRLPGDLSLHGEWGADDSGEAFIRVPAFRAGVDWNVLPFAPALSAGLDAVLITPAFDTYPPWYQHLGLGDGWTNDGRLLGHPLGGHGRELTLSVSASLPDAQARSGITLRHRGAQNLFAPHLAGNSLVLAGAGTLWLNEPLQLHASGEVERHEDAGWSWTLRVGLKGQVGW